MVRLITRSYVTNCGEVVTWVYSTLMGNGIVHNSYTNKLSLTTAKPKAKVDLYNLWNKAFRVLTEIFALKWPDQCLPMVQYAAEISDNIGKFSFATTYNYDIKFRLKKQMKPALKWNEIDNSLWTKCFSGSGRDGYLINISLQEEQENGP